MISERSLRKMKVSDIILDSIVSETALSSPLAKSNHNSLLHEFSMQESIGNGIVNATNFSFQAEQPSQPPRRYVKSEETLAPTTKESSSIYHFYKILSNDSYTLGKKVADFIKDFGMNYRNIEESVSLLPSMIESILRMTEETVQSFLCEFNYGKNEAKNLLPYCRMSVEKYLFEKLYHVIFPIYQFKNKASIERFNSIRETYFGSLYTIGDILKSLEVSFISVKEC
eukprot:TRINITY_DN3499_c0_g1_i18.p1 TRINITY_DN3499_c0_g1~~TRINITY_DN3499_c0_g1_i18.p1  ORF type:complete len:227 (-),score=38.67 TRINITY_DN3499_c0_g1_i18:228-908(-)